MSKAVQPAEHPAERRRASRTALRLSATMREQGRSRVGVRVIDISTHGCRVEATTSLVGADTWIWLSIAGLDTQYCRVVWQHQEFAGLEFATPLSEAVLERLVEDQNDLSETSISELRDIALRAHRLASGQSEADAQILADLSRNCAVEALVEGLRLGQGSGAKPAARPQRRED